jgi:hypothetical protein
MGGNTMTNRSSLTSRGALIGYAVLAVAVIAIAGFLAYPRGSEVSAYNTDANDVAIKGYDTVAYFTKGKATKGSEEFQHSWQDAQWHFTSANHRDLFTANPERYAPRYGGYCALGLAAGEYADSDPEAWTIVDGKLYLNNTKGFREVWRKAPEAHIGNAEYNWENNRDALRVNL